MAIYKHAGNLVQSNDSAFDTLHHPGYKAPHSGVYRCTGCGWEVTSEKGNPLPPQNHHQHANRQPILWKMIVYANHKAA